jgi:glycosyltransferase involved in cell wall biosynthesis
MSNYKLSILIPTYNRLDLFKETLNSIIPQAQGKPVHIAIVDDGSTEGNYEYALELSKKYPFIEIARHEKNLGVGVARNTLLGLAKGDYLIFFDSDDLLLDRGLEKMLDLIDSEIAEVYVLNTYREKGKKLKFKIFPEDKTEKKLLKAFLEGKFSEALYLVKSDIAKKFSFSSNLRVMEDLPYQGKLILHSKIKIINQPFAIKRDHPQRLRKVSDYYFQNAIDAIEDLFKRLPSEYQCFKPFAYAKTYLDLGKRAYLNSDLAKAKDFLKKAIECYPKIRKDFKYWKLRFKILFKNFLKK